MLKIYTLGGFNVQQSTQTSVQDDVPAVDPEEQPITGFISRKVEALLVYLAIERREHPREVLAELLWQDAPQARAMANLRMALSNLQQLIAPYLLVSRQTVSLNPDSEIWLDVAQLESAIDATETHWMRGLPKHVLTRLEKGLDLYRGDFLVGFQLKDSRSFDGWRTLEQERLRGRMIETSHQLASYMMERKMFAAGLQHGTRLLQLDPSWEEAHQMMMIMLAKSGQRNLALAQYETCRRILREELDVEPDERTTEIYEQILAEKILPATINVPPHNLPALATPFVRRHIELSQLAERLDEPNCRLLTLVGPGGMGKTRIALQAAMDRVNDFRNGIFFIPLAEIHSPEYVVAAINSNLSETLKVTLTDKNGLIDYLREKEMLLVMDNFEHVLESADLISEILRAAPAIKVLVTSREQLNLQEEWILPIEGMAFPRSVKAVGADVFGAVQLFVQAAQRVRPTFSLSEQSQEVIRICQLVEGMPLGLELAASWVRTMSCAEIAQQIQSDLDFLETSRRNMPERHRSIRALFEQSWRALTNDERAALMRLSAFEGTFDLTAAQAVAGASPRVLASLVEKSLLRSEERSRYAAHSLLRRFAFEKMIEHGGEDVRVRFIDYYLLWAERIAGTMNVAPNGAQKDSTHLIESEHENLLSAMEYALEGGLKDKLLRLSWALTDFWLARGHFAEARHWTQNALELHGDAKDDLRARAYYTAAYAAWRQGDLQVARNLAQEALEIELSGETPTAQAAEVYNLLGHINAHLGDRETARALYEKALIIAREIPNGKVAAILNNLGLVASDLCDFFTAQRYFEEAVGLLRDSGDQSKMATVLLNLGVVAVQQNDLDLATKYYEEALEIVQALKIVPNIAVALCNLGEVAHKQGDFPKASKLYSESVGLLYQLGDKLSTTIVLEAIGRLAAAQHQPERAAVLLGLSEAWRETLGAPMSPRDRADYDIDVTRIHRELSSGRFAELWAQGRHMSLEEGIVLVAQ